jgi:hypothetical protein
MIVTTSLRTFRLLILQVQRRQGTVPLLTRMSPVHDGEWRGHVAGEIEHFIQAPKAANVGAAEGVV